MLSPKLSALVATLATCVVGTGLIAEDSMIIGPRSLGMGGTGVASADDWSASYYNPAIFAYFNRPEPEGTRVDNNNLARRGDFGLNVLDFQAGATQRGEIADYLTTIADNLGTIRDISDNGLSSPQQLQAFVRVTAALSNMDNPANAIGVDANAGIGMRIGHMGIGVRTWGQGYGFVQDLDLVNLAIDGVTASLDQEIQNAANLGELATSITVLQGLDLDGNPGTDSDGELALEYQAQQLNLTAQEAQDLVAVLNGAAAAYGNPSAGIANNQTKVILSGITMAEIPISYGYGITERFSIGATVKLMVGRVHGATILVFDEDNNDFTSVLDDYEQSFNFGLDVGALYRFPFVNVGLNLRNLNSPTFSAPQGYSDIQLEPQATLGAGFFPFKTLGFTCDIDLLKNESVVRNYEQQRIMLGAEWDAFRFLALRLGGYRNMAADDTVGTVLTAGFGVNFWVIRLDFGGAYSLDTVEVDGSDLPREARVGFRLASEW